MVKRIAVIIVITLIVLTISIQASNLRWSIQVKEVKAEGVEPFIEGNVFSEGEPVADARITLMKFVQQWQRFDDTKVIRVSSDEKGYFIINNVTPGYYQLMVQKQGYTTVKGRFELPEGKSLKVTVEILRRRMGFIIPIPLPY